MQRISIVVIFALLAVACGAPVVQPSVPALLINPGPETLQEVVHTVSTAMNVTTVTLATDVLTKSSVLDVERGMKRGINRPGELGRDPGRPYRFQLVMDGLQCVLVDQQTTQHWPLKTVKCIKE